MTICFKCNQKLELNGQNKISRQEECPQCYASLHSCKMCFFYDQTAYNECRESMADRIVEKDKANFCDYYKLGDGLNNNKNNSQLLNAAESLFKK